MYDENIAATYGMPEITVIADYAITPEIAEQCYEMGEQKYYKSTAVDLQTYIDKFYILPDFCFVFMHKQTKKPIGYFITLPLTDDAIIRYMAGELTNSHISKSDYKKLEEGSLYNLYFDSKVLYKQYHTPKMSKMFFALLMQAVIDAAKKGSYLNYLLIDQYKNFSKTLAKILNTKFLRRHVYPSGQIVNLFGALFDYQLYKKLPNFCTLDFSYSNVHAKQVLAGEKDLWEEYKKQSGYKEGTETELSFFEG